MRDSSRESGNLEHKACFEVVHPRFPSRCKRKTASIITSLELGAPDWDWQSGFFADFLSILRERFFRNQVKKEIREGKVGSPTMQKDLCGQHLEENRNSASAHVVDIGQKPWPAIRVISLGIRTVPVLSVAKKLAAPRPIPTAPAAKCGHISSMRTTIFF